MSEARPLNAETINIIYELLLGRAPESDTLVQKYIEYCDLKDMRNSIVGSPEFIGCALKKARGTEIAFFEALHIDELNGVMRCLEHLNTLNLAISGKRTAVVGSGLGLMASYFAVRWCKVDLFDASSSMMEIAKAYIGASDDESLTRNVGFNVVEFDSPGQAPSTKFDLTICYNYFWQSKSASDFLDNLAAMTENMLIVETRVAFGEHEDLLVMVDPNANRMNAGQPNLRHIPTRKWLWSALGDRFPFVYVPRTQPRHHGFPNNWSRPINGGLHFGRAVFIASRTELDLETLSPQLLAKHENADAFIS